MGQESACGERSGEECPAWFLGEQRREQLTRALDVARVRGADDQKASAIAGQTSGLRIMFACTQ